MCIRTWDTIAYLQRFYKKAAAFVLRAVAKHSPELAQASLLNCLMCTIINVSLQSVVDSGALEGLVICLEEFNPGVKEASAWAMGYIARHNGGEVTLILTNTSAQ